MNYYQIKILGTPFRIDDLITSISQYDYIQIIEGTENNSFPVLYLYFANSSSDKTSNGVDLKSLEQNLKVIPIIKDLHQCSDFIPDDLCSINALELPDNDCIEKLTNAILRYFGLLDVNRKVFISYKRDDCQGLAQQLFVELSKRNYIPFLDSYTIEPSVNFQKHLRHELSDCEIMLFINSPNYENSKWCMEELSIATEIQASIVQLKFENTKEIREGDFSRIVPMGSIKGKMDEYPEKIDAIVNEIEKYRAMGFEIRRQSLVSMLNDKYANAAFHNTMKGLLISDKLQMAIYLLNRIPSSVDLQNAEKLICDNKVDDTYKKSVAFNGMYCRFEVSNHHKWLNATSIPVKFNDITK